MGNSQEAFHRDDEQEDQKTVEPDINTAATKEALDKDASSRELAIAIKADLDNARKNLKKLATEKNSVLDPREEMDFQKRISALEEKPNKEEAQKLVEELENYKERKLKQGKEEDMERDKDDPELAPYFKEINTLFDDPETAKFIGTKQLQTFKEWCLKRANKKLTIRNIKETLELVKNHSIDGIKPRKAYYETQIKPFLDRYGMDITKSPLLSTEGLSERKTLLPLMKESAEKLEKGHRLGLYSFKAKQKIIGDLIKAQNSQEVWKTAGKINKVSRQENEQSVDIFKNTKVTVHGIPIRAMSDASTQAFLSSYKEYSLEEREKTVMNWKKIVENEGKLIKEFGDVYKDDPEGFKDAIESFSLMDYQQKQKAIQEHKTMRKTQEKEVLRESMNILKDSFKAIEEARRDKILCPTTAKRFQEFINDKKRYTNPKTGKIDIEKQKKLYEALTSKTPVYEKDKRNIEAYAKRRTAFKADLKDLSGIPPEMTADKMADKQAEYDEETYSKRLLLHKKLKDETRERKKQAEENKKRKNKIGITEEIGAKEDSAESSTERTKLISVLEECIKEKTPESVKKGLKAIFAYINFMYSIDDDFKISEDKKLNLLENQLKDLEKNIGTSNKEETQTEEAKREEEAKKAISETPDIEEELKELRLTEEAEEMIGESERQHGGNIDTEERSEKDALGRAKAANTDQETTEIEEEIIKDYYEQGGTLDRENRGGEETRKIEVNRGLEQSELDSFKNLILEERRGHSIDRKGTARIKMTDKEGRTLDEDMREKMMEERQEDVASRITEKMEERTNKTTGGVANLAERIANKRAAEKIAKEEINKKEAA